MDNKPPSEQDIRTRYITRAIIDAGWDLHSQVSEEYPFTAGRIEVRGKLHSRGKPRRADYVLFYKPNHPIAVVEAKNDRQRDGDGMQQALAYAEALDTPFVFTSNGDGFVFHDKTGLSPQMETKLTLDQFPSPTELWQRYCTWKGLSIEAKTAVEFPYHEDGSGKSPRYYQANAINRTVEAVANGQDRILLVMATGTGKTYTAFQIIWRLWKSRQKKRILFLADRNILVDQTKTNDFKPFGKAMTKIAKRDIKKAFEIYLSLYQAVTGSEEERNVYKQFSPDFFDLVVIDECHRGSARADSAWREVLEYFSSATHIGLTATPKETKEVSNIDYFGEPIYTYSLRQGIKDGFLAPYKVVRIDIDRDVNGWRPEKGKRDASGQLIEDRTYNQRDMDRSLVLTQRTKLVAKTITEYLDESGDPYQKTIVFCENIDHARRMREALVNHNKARMLEDARYVMRITGDDSVGKAELDNFIDPEERYPVVAVTSKLMTTGVDAQTCKLVVLDQNIQSMTEFKQIIGRGTRVNEDYGKYWFTIMDFRKATELFADKDFDGDPVQVYEPKPGESPVPPEGNTEDEQHTAGGEHPDDSGDDGLPGDDSGGDTGGGNPRPKFVVDDVTAEVTGKRVQYLDANGKLITESLRDYTRARVSEQFASLDDFLRRWTSAEKKKAVIDELAEQGVMLEELQAEVQKKTGVEMDAFDLICHVVYGQPPLSRRERANQVKKRDYFTKYEGATRQVLEGLIDKYADEGIAPIEDVQILRIAPFCEIGAPLELIGAFGGKPGYEAAVRELESQLYA